MKLTTSHQLVAAALIALTTAGSAQVAGVGYTIAPRAAYLFPSDNSGLQNQFAIGADLGFSFGQFIELRANYIQGIGGATDLERLGEELLDGNLPDERDVNVRRLGGDVKFNLGKGAFLPYLLIGTGIQTLELEDDLEENIENENIYGNAGLGFVLSAADRYTFFVEGRYLQYRNNAFQALTTDLDRTELGITSIDGANRRVGSYSIEAGAAFYLGGRRPGEMTDLDRAYAEQFGNGFRGATVEIEPTLSRINFADASPFRDTWLGGAALGFDFGPLVGVRGYYLRAMQDDNINFDFDDLAVYGLDMRFNLNTVQTGIAPFLTVGGGLIDPRGGYLGNDDIADLSGTGFASGGGGIVLGLTRNLKVRGTVKALLTSASELDADELVTTDQINTSTQFSIGLDLALGRKARDGNDILAERTAEARDRQRERDLVQRDSILTERDAAYASQLSRRDSISESRLARSQFVRDSIRQDYERELAEREEELAEAIAERDRVQIDSMRALVRETETLLGDIQAADADAREREMERQRARDNVYAADLRTRRIQDPYVEERYVRDADGRLRIQREYREPASQTQGGTIRMSVAEFEGLLEEIFESSLPMGPEAFAPAAPAGARGPSTDRSGFRFDPMTGEPLPPSATDAGAMRRENADLRRELDKLSRDIDAMRRSEARDTKPTSQPTSPRQDRSEAPSSRQPNGTSPVEDTGATVLDGIGVRAEESREQRTENDGGQDQRETAPATNEMPEDSGVVRVGPPEPPVREETRKERRARERAERKARKAREKADDDNG